MLSSLVLDALLVLILLMIIPLGFFRGGLREVCTSGGLLLGILLAEQWASRWGQRVADVANIDEGAATFAVAVAIVVLAAAIVGYGASAAFAYRPGPGGRLYGGYLALLNGMVFAGFLINAVIVYVNDGERPAMIEDGYVSRALSVGFEWVLLAGAGGILLATLFGMFVRERAEDEFAYVPPAHASEPAVSAAPTRRLAPPTEPEKIEPPAPAESHPTAPVRIREVRHWEDRTEPPQREYGGGWQRTWPGATPSQPQRSARDQTARYKAQPTTPPATPGASQGTDKDVLRQWLDQDRSQSDE
ncbi:MAG TPA: CvpA family protein [Thermomicrobiales bacterium]|nr:CvpA family protein [Thermomicrobiales bacterium]